jgi:SRSO17 transposase
VTHQEGWRIGLDLVRTSGQELPHGWVTGDDEFGRAGAFRSLLRLDGERYVLDVPCNTSVRDLSERRPPSGPGRRERLPAFERVDAWAKRQPKRRWRQFLLPGGEKGPRAVKALQQWVQTKDEDGCGGPRERLVVIRSCEKRPRTWYTLSNAAKEVALAEVVRAHGEHHGVEELFKDGNQEVGLNHYEVRSWVGWHHHMALTLLALWFLQLERLRLGGKKSADHGGAGAGDLHGAVGGATAQRAGDRGEGERGAAA